MRKPRSRAIEENEPEDAHFQGFIKGLCPHVVLCKDNNTSRLNMKCDAENIQTDDQTQKSGFVRIRNTTCKSWMPSYINVQEHFVVVKCIEDNGKEVNLWLIQI